MNPTFRQLKMFLAFTEHMSITVAARACHVTQPTVSMQLRELAQQVGMPLYERIGKRLYLTPAGEALKQSARAMMREWDSLKQHIDGLQGNTRGQLRVAVVSTAKYFVPRLLGSFCARYPDIDISLEVLNRDGVVARLRDNRDDLYIMSMPPADIELERRAFLDNPLVVIAPLDHPLAKDRRVAVSALSQWRFILRELGSGTRLACEQHFRQLGWQPDVRLELGSNEAIKQAVAAGMGLSVISRHSLAAIPGREQLAVLDVAGFPVITHWWTLHPKGKQLSPIAREFLQHLETNTQQLQQAE